LQKTPNVFSKSKLDSLGPTAYFLRHKTLKCCAI